jgi:signal transduction histidine kinase
MAALACALSWLAGGATIYFALKRAQVQLFDERLGDIGQALLVFAGHEVHEIEAAGGPLPSHIETDGTAQGRYRYQVWSVDGRLLMASRSAPPDRPLVPLGPIGWSTRTVGDQELRAITLRMPGQPYFIQVAEPTNQRLEAGDLLGGPLLVAVAVSVLALGTSTLLLLRLALRPLRDATAQLRERGPADLRAVATGQLPREFAPVFDSINHLMQRLDVALRSEREFVSAAAHELRTPLAGLRAQAEVAAHARSSGHERAAALAAVQDGVDHAAHLVGQLLDLARSDALAGDPTRLNVERQPVTLSGVLDRVLGELGPIAAERGLRVQQQLAVGSIRGSDFGIGLIVRNLLANAVAHARAGGVVAVGTRAEPGRVVLWLADDGPGIAAAERDRLFERFYRGKGNTLPGCGLGLSIVKALADAHGAEVRLANAELGGLLVEIRFPAG